MNDWMNNPAMIMMALISGANKQGIRFTPEEMTLILDILKDGKSKEEREQIDRTINMASSLFRKHNGK